MQLDLFKNLTLNNNQSKLFTGKKTGGNISNPKKTSKMSMVTKQKSMTAMLQDGVPYKVIATVLSMKTNLVSDFARDNGLQSEKSKSFTSKESRTHCVPLEVIYNQMPEKLTRGFALFVRHPSGKVTLPHERQCRRILDYPIASGGDFWCQNHRDADYGNGLYCHDCYKKMYIPIIRKKNKVKYD